MVESGRGRGEDSDGVSSQLWGEHVGQATVHDRELLSMDAEGIRADMHMKVCSRLCNHKDIAPATAVGCRVWYTMVCKSGHRAIDKRYRKAVEKVWVNP